jgi:putative component of membrane protein insertase Oxa1/YidC/SpoIIIJ protein YidD
VRQALILLARGWQLGPSRLLPPTCRFQPSSSQYAIDA